VLPHQPGWEQIHADASKSKAVSYGYLPKLEARLRAEVEELLTLADQTDQADLPVGLDSTFVRIGWSIWPRPRRCWKSGPRSDTKRSKPNMKRRCVNGSRKRKRPGTNLGVVLPNRRCQGQALGINTILPTRTRPLGKTVPTRALISTTRSKRRWSNLAC
jgi:hypothetical protein